MNLSRRGLFGILAGAAVVGKGSLAPVARKTARPPMQVEERNGIEITTAFDFDRRAWCIVGMKLPVGDFGVGIRVTQEGDIEQAQLQVEMLLRSSSREWLRRGELEGVRYVPLLCRPSEMRNSSEMDVHMRETHQIGPEWRERIAR